MAPRGGVPSFSREQQLWLLDHLSIGMAAMSVTQQKPSSISISSNTVGRPATPSVALPCACGWPKKDGQLCTNPVLPQSNGRCGVHARCVTTASRAPAPSTFNHNHTYMSTPIPLQQVRAGQAAPPRCTGIVANGQRRGQACSKGAVHNGRCSQHQY